MKKTKKALLSMILSAAMFIAMLPGMSMVAKAVTGYTVTVQGGEALAPGIDPGQEIQVPEGTIVEIRELPSDLGDFIGWSSEISLTITEGSMNAGVFRFTMPAADVTINARYNTGGGGSSDSGDPGSGAGSEGGSGSTPQQYTISNAEGCTVTAPSAAEGTQITITAADRTSFNLQFDHWKITENSATGTDITSTILLGNTAKDSSTTFSMPAKNIYVMPVFATVSGSGSGSGSGSESHETTEMPTGGLFAGKYGKYQVFDVSRSPAYPAGTQENPSKFSVSSFKAPFGVGTSITEDGWFYFKPSADQTITYNPNWGVAGAYIVELWYNDNHGYDAKVNSGVIGGIANEGFFYEGDSHYGYYFSNNAGYEYGFSGLSYTPVANGKVVCDVDVLTNYTAGSMLVPEGYNTNESTASISVSGETAVKGENPIVPNLNSEAASQGDDVTLDMQITADPETTFAANPTLNSEPEVKEEVKGQFKDESAIKVDVLHINVRKLVAGVFAATLTNTNSVLEIGVGYNFTGKYDPSLVSKHGDEVRTFATLTARPTAGNYINSSFFADTENDKFYIYSKDYSDFVISYSTVEGNAQNRTVINPNAGGSSGTSSSPKTIPVYRLFNKVNGNHLFTTNAEEKDILVANGWADEGIAWQVVANTDTPVYRLFDATGSGEHFYTANATLKSELIAKGCVDEGVAWYGQASTGRTVYKATNTTYGKSVLTTSVAEKDALVAAGFTVEEADFKVN